MTGFLLVLPRRDEVIPVFDSGLGEANSGFTIRSAAVSGFTGVQVYRELSAVCSD